jgi:hypothetical protein
MAIPATGSVSLQNIEDEFGGTGEISLSEYYRGNTYESAVSGNNTAVPQSGSIKFSQFRGSELKRYIQYKVLGAGGGGGGGFEDRGYDVGTFGAGGGSSTLSATGFTTVTAGGGVGGQSGILTWPPDQTIVAGGNANIAAGYSQDFGVSGGGTGQLANGAPGTGSGAGGSGGGGDDPGTYDNSGGAGAGGSAGAEVGGNAYFSIGAVLTYSIGAGGAGYAHTTAGAAGRPGYVVLISNGTEVVASDTSSTYTVV